MQSLYFNGTVGETLPVAKFDPTNFLMRPEIYNYQGHWVFCRFDSDEILGARFGFGRGTFDLSDYGVNSPTDCSFVMRHFEVMTRDGAYIWLGSGKNMAKDLRFSRDKMEFEMVENSQRSFHIAGWPLMQWHYCTPDGDMELDLQLDVSNVTLLPDSIMEHNIFAMWVALASCRGTVRIRDKMHKLSGHAFYDHSRINQVWNAIVPFGWSMYAPVYFSDGSSLVLFHSRDREGNKVRNYNFGLYVDENGKGRWIADSQITGMTFDAEDWPDRWTAEIFGENFQAKLHFTVNGTSVSKAWGPFPVAQTRKDNFNIPLACDCSGTLSLDGSTRDIAGKGLCEYLSHKRMISL